MKKQLIFFFFLFCTLMAVNGHSAPQFSDKRVHFADIYKRAESRPF